MRGCCSSASFEAMPETIRNSSVKAGLPCPFWGPQACAHDHVGPRMQDPPCQLVFSPSQERGRTLHFACS